jgi:Ni2+-binding GTPase involved in maturation of urease and hydrogenase
MLLNKTDLLPHLNFDIEKCIAYAHDVNPAIIVLKVSATTGRNVRMVRLAGLTIVPLVICLKIRNNQTELSPSNWDAIAI